MRDETYLKCLNGMRPGAEAASDRTKSGEAMLRKAAMNGAARRAMFRESCYTRPTCSESIFFLCGRLCELRPCDVDFPRLEFLRKDDSMNDTFEDQGVWQCKRRS